MPLRRSYAEDYLARGTSTTRPSEDYLARCTSTTPAAHVPRKPRGLRCRIAPSSPTPRSGVMSRDNGPLRAYSSRRYNSLADPKTPRRADVHEPPRTSPRGSPSSSTGGPRMRIFRTECLRGQAGRACHDGECLRGQTKHGDAAETDLQIDAPPLLLQAEAGYPQQGGLLPSLAGSSGGPV
jgi:hypothetical protein